MKWNCPDLEVELPDLMKWHCDDLMKWNYPDLMKWNCPT